MRVIPIIFNVYGSSVLLDNSNSVLRYIDIDCDSLDAPVDVACTLVKETFKKTIDIYNAFVVRTQMCAVKGPDGSVVDNVCTVAVLCNNSAFDRIQPVNFHWYSVNSDIVRTRLEPMDYAYLQEAYSVIYSMTLMNSKVPVVILNESYNCVITQDGKSGCRLPVVTLDRDDGIEKSICELFNVKTTNEPGVFRSESGFEIITKLMSPKLGKRYLFVYLDFVNSGILDNLTDMDYVVCTADAIADIPAMISMLKELKVADVDSSP